MAGKILAGIDIGSRRTRARLNGWLKESGLRRVLHPSLRLLKGTSPNPCNVMNTLETITPLCMEVHHLHVTHLEVQHNLDTSVKRNAWCQDIRCAQSSPSKPLGLLELLESLPSETASASVCSWSPPSERLHRITPSRSTL